MFIFFLTDFYRKHASREITLLSYEIVYEMRKVSSQGWTKITEINVNNL